MRTRAVRCLASLVYTFNTHYHTNVTYEDAPLEFLPDMADVTAPKYRLNPSNHVFIPRGGPLEFRYVINSSDRLPSDSKQAMLSLLEAYRASGYPGEYLLIESKGTLHVVPSTTRDANGKRKPVTPLMDSPITVRHEDSSTVGGVIRAVLAATGHNTGREIVLGTILPQQFERIPFAKDLDSVSAREALQQAIAAGGIDMSWVLLYDPTVKYYVFTPYNL